MNEPLTETLSYRRLLKYWLLTFALVIAGSWVSIPHPARVFALIDALIHLALYTVLGFIPMIFFRSRKTTFLLAISMAPFGYLIETLHVALTSESFNAVNALFNNLGVLIGIAAGFVVRLKSYYQREGRP